jgi:hypothetical protein
VNRDYAPGTPSRNHANAASDAPVFEVGRLHGAGPAAAAIVGRRPVTVNLRTGKSALPEQYAPSTINHALPVLSGFYR